MSDGRIELHPEVQRVMDENALLRDELAARLAELHDLQHIVKPNLLAIYQTKLGPWDLRLLQAQCICARLKRKAELVQACLNRGQPPDFAAIETALEVEFLAWQQRVQETAQKIEAAQFRLGHLLAPGEDAELKKLYHALVKKLHPDVNPELLDEMKDLWLQVVAAYEAGDLQKLKTLALLTDKSGATTAASNSLDALRAEHERLRTHVMQLLRQLAEVGKQPPFSLRRQWEDDAWVAQRREEVEALTATANEQAQALEKHLQALIIVHGSGKQFGLN